MWLPYTFLPLYQSSFRQYFPVVSFFIVSVNSMISADPFKETTKLSYRSDD